jgi:small-conductance mechanosensitive channel
LVIRDGVSIGIEATSKDKYQQVKQKILLNIADIITKHKAEIAYPTQTLHIQTNANHFINTTIGHTRWCLNWD